MFSNTYGEGSLSGTCENLTRSSVYMHPVSFFPRPAGTSVQKHTFGDSCQLIKCETYTSFSGPYNQLCMWNSKAMDKHRQVTIKHHTKATGISSNENTNLHVTQQRANCA